VSRCFPSRYIRSVWTATQGTSDVKPSGQHCQELRQHEQNQDKQANRSERRADERDASVWFRSGDGRRQRRPAEAADAYTRFITACTALALRRFQALILSCHSIFSASQSTCSRVRPESAAAQMRLSLPECFGAGAEDFGQTAGSFQQVLDLMLMRQLGALSSEHCAGTAQVK
jgi:hypothetical protein